MLGIGLGTIILGIGGRVAMRGFAVLSGATPGFSAGGTTTVGSMASLGSGLRITIAGGVNCSRANLGRLPFDAANLSRWPPPPPPPASVFDGGRM